MIPLSDETRRRQFPLVNVTIIAINILVFLYMLLILPQVEGFIFSLGMIPAEITSGRDLPPAPGPQPIYLTLLTSVFIHGGFLHIGSNMLYLWVFGDNVEDQMGHLRYAIFYLLGGLIASATHIAVSPVSRIPSVGASGAIAAVLGAYLIMFPKASIRTLVFLGPFIVLPRLSALVLIGFWGILQLLSGIASLGAETAQTGGIGYWAHIGGFVAGLVLVHFFRQRRRTWAAG